MDKFYLRLWEQKVAKIIQGINNSPLIGNEAVIK